MLGLPLTGWAAVSASPYNIPTVLFGIVPWPHLPWFSTLSDKKAANEILESIHSWGAWILIALLGLHIGAALRHHFIQRDTILLRMLPYRRLP
jgi:cytochrome b561